MPVQPKCDSVARSVSVTPLRAWGVLSFSCAIRYVRRVHAIEIVKLPNNASCFVEEGCESAVVKDHRG